MVKIKRVYDPASPGDGKRVLVDRLWPRGLKREEAAIDDWLKDIAPSAELRKWFGHDPVKWHDFKNRYQGELKEKTGIVERLRQEARTRTVTLLFAARDAEHNNAVVLREVIAR
ncbi:MAG: DUF488 domain-containing protein [Syntrophales bacterium]